MLPKQDMGENIQVNDLFGLDDEDIEEEDVVSGLSIQLGDEDLNEEETLLARIPLLAGSNKKAAYLAYRSVGFSVANSAELAEVTTTTIHNWRKNDSVFRNFEANELKTLQSTVAIDVVRFEFLRNMKLLLKKDFQLIAKGMGDLEKLSAREYEIFKGLRRFYSANEYLSLEKALHPEKHQTGPVTFHLTWGNRVDNVIEGQGREIGFNEGESGSYLPELSTNVRESEYED